MGIIKIVVNICWSSSFFPLPTFSFSLFFILLFVQLLSLVVFVPCSEYWMLRDRLLPLLFSLISSSYAPLRPIVHPPTLRPSLRVSLPSTSSSSLSSSFTVVLVQYICPTRGTAQQVGWRRVQREAILGSPRDNKEQRAEPCCLGLD